MTEESKTMKAAVVHKKGDPTTPEVLSVEEIPIPEPKQGEVLIKVQAAAINPVDYKLVEGVMPGHKPEGPIGADVCGIVETIGPDTTCPFQVGDAVYGDGIKNKGSFAQYMVAPAVAMSKKPSNITAAEAASIPLAGLTALQGLRTKAGMQTGQKVLVFGGSGGVGSLAIQVAKALGASEVYATGSNVDHVKSFGADVVINYKEQDLMESLKGKDFDIVYDTVGGFEHWEVAQASMTKKGKFITIAGDSSGSMMMDMGAMVKRTMKAKIFGGQQYIFFLTSTNAPEVVEDMLKLTELIESGSLKPALDDRKFKLTTEGIHDLVKASKSHRAKGKLVLLVE